MRAPFGSMALATALTVLVSASPAFAQGQIRVFSSDAQGTGFFDPTPAAPVGGNPGTTLGEQRQNVFLLAAAIWTEKLQPTTDIFVIANFVPLAANVLGSAGTIFIFRDFPGAEYPSTWYHSALGDKLAGQDLDPTVFDIQARFSTNFVFYLGFDNNEGTLVDLLPVVLHEMGHGLGFANFVNELDGSSPQGLGDIFSAYTLDVTTGKRWNDMTAAERAVSAINVRHVSWDGLHVNEAVPSVLLPGEPSLVIASPAGLGPYAVGAASFGPQITAPGITGNIVVGLDPADAAGPSPTDGCSPLTNGAQITGKIALLDRGTCGFIVKVKNAQNAGAIAVVIADNAPGDPPQGLGGADPTIIISSVRISITAGNQIKAALNSGPVNGTLGVDLSILAGTDRVRGLMMLAAFNPVISGSSISHYEPVAFRNLLMEPAINNDLTSSVEPPLDLTLPQMTDVGWFSDHDGVPDGRDACLGSAQTPTVEVQSCVSTAPNVVFSDGCRISDQVEACAAGASNHGGFVSCVTHLVNDLRKAGVLTQAQRNSLHDCAAGSSLP